MTQNNIIKKGLIVGIILLSTLPACLPALASESTFPSAIGNQGVQTFEDDFSHNSSCFLWWEGMRIVRIEVFLSFISKFYIPCLYINFLVKNGIYSLDVDYCSVSATMERIRTGEKWHGGMAWIGNDRWEAKETRCADGFHITDNLLTFCVPGFYKLDFSLSFHLSRAHPDDQWTRRTYNKTIFISMPFFAFPKIVSSLGTLSYNPMIIEGKL